MNYLSIRTRGSSTPERKPRVYFTCHPEDFARYFDTVCEDIFKTQDCAIYYTADMTAPLPEKYRETDLGSMNLFVVPVTFRLLTEPNRAMDSDIAFALEKHVPILPLMMETGINEFYAEKFGELQYLSPYIHDLTAISYEEKLKKYLAFILIDDETAEKVRAAFDAYIFLSYRKKDRQYANELMKLIHANPLYQDIAIWYDEFLTPGESFSDSIEKMLEKSDLFTLLVTPNLVNEENYVKSVEYPAAKQANKKVLPAEMVETDANELKKQYDGIPDTVKAKDDAALRESLAQAFASYARRENDDDPMHNYLIGLAYLEGIDVEVNRKKAVELITKAADAELPEAMEKLYKLYVTGDSIQRDLYMANEWAKKCYDYYVRLYGEKSRKAISSLSNLIMTYDLLGDYKKASELQEKEYKYYYETLGENEPVTWSQLNKLADFYKKSKEYQKAIQLYEKLLFLSRNFEVIKKQYTFISLDKSTNNIQVFDGSEEPFVTIALINIALLSQEFGDFSKAKHAIQELDDVAFNYWKNGDYKKELIVCQRLFDLKNKILGEKHLSTFATLKELAHTYGRLKNYQKKTELLRKLVDLQTKTLGRTNIETLRSIKDYSYAVGGELGNKKAISLEKNIYLIFYLSYGKKDADTIDALNNIALTYAKYSMYKESYKTFKKVYKLRRKVIGEKHPDTLTTLHNIGATSANLNNYKEAVECFEKAHSLRCEVLGEKHADTLLSLQMLHSCRHHLEGQ